MGRETQARSPGNLGPFRSQIGVVRREESALHAKPFEGGIPSRAVKPKRGVEGDELDTTHVVRRDGH